MILTFTCQCSNEVQLYAAGDRDEHGRYWLDVEDDDRLTIINGEGGSVFRCEFCKQSYRLLAT
ncbi:hypothetical protein K0T92_05090 [Paenibacillus oenotherae]|uniref:Uncharacterized protein n=1 Tax=Paenibacillus oenotherae TaxID=1435645 RepID=A0ABS7D2E0_9BACL|nr:hypothetical protein [Paenibacillus oenotherae]MBW7474109.1 hypothetical protein [Paenibacillus oenotherae]